MTNNKAYIQNFKFEECKDKIPYSLIHENPPIKLTSEMSVVLEYLLWYIPNINSLQSPKNDLVSSIVFQDFVFGIIKEVMGLNNEDVAIVHKIERNVVNFYSKYICPDKEKIILTQADNESKTNALLRHTRNALAHGYFNIIGDLLIAFDFKNSTDYECSAIIKIKASNLLKALETLQSEVTSERLAQISLQRTGYYVEKFKSQNPQYHFDFFAKKDNYKFAVEIKKYKSYKTLPEKEVDKLVKQFENVFETMVPILFMDTSLLTEKSKDRLIREKVIILDIKNITKMLNKRDMIMEILKN